MKRYFIDHPVYYSLKDYTTTISSLIENIQKDEGIVSIYQIGHIANPGISDIDILVIFENDFKSMSNPLENSGEIEKYLLVHNLFGLSKDYFCEAQKYSFFHNYKIIYGQELEIGSNLNDSQIDIIKNQIALEYLLQFYVSFSIQKKYGIYKVRNILLSVKALMYDLEFLGIKGGSFHELINKILIMRENWFHNKSSINELNNL